MPSKIPVPIKFNWDEYNKYKNWHKHQITFKECEEIFFNQPLKTFFDKKHSQKKRYVALGTTNIKRKLYLVFTIRNKQIRIISARNQNKKERQIYE